MKEIHIHCIGIGGIGLSALAQYYLHSDVCVTGSDVQTSKVTEMLESKGVTVFIGHSAAHITSDITQIFYSPAIPETNVELVAARALCIPTHTYPEGLGMISKNKKTIAVSGTHGKTSTTAMVAHILETAGRSPTVIVGSLLAERGTNFISGTSEVFVVEACEFKRSFHELSPFIVVITNIDNDHLDYYGNMENLVQAFKELIQKVPESGYVILDKTLQYVHDICANVRATIIDVSVQDTDFALRVPGAHMRSNARLAAQVGLLFGISLEESKKILETFAGTWRRSEYKGVTENGAQVFDDYGHHPTEIRVTLAGFREKYPDKKIVCIFQPHLYSRTHLLFYDFARSFSDVDMLYIAPIYAAREQDEEIVSSEMLVDAIRQQGIETYAFAGSELSSFKNMNEDTIIITLGAGEMNLVAEKIIDNNE